MIKSGRIGVDQFLAMATRGDFDPIEDHHLELIRGEIVPRYGDDPRNHRSPALQWAVDEVMDWSFDVTDRGLLRIRVQAALSISALDSVPVQDLVWAAPRRYHRALPSPADVFLLIEVVDPGLRTDRGPKLGLYAEAGIRDYWIINIKGRCVEVHRDPEGSKYRSVTVHTPGQTIHPLAFPDLSLEVSRIFPD